MTEKEIIEYAIVGINYSITRCQKRIIRATEYLHEIESGLPTLCKKSKDELYEVLCNMRDQIEELEERRFELEIKLTEKEN